MKTSKSQIKAVARYDKKNTTSFHIKLNKKTDEDLIALLAKVENKQGLIKELLREYLSKQ